MFGNIGNIGRSLFGGIAPISNTLMLGGMGLMSGGDPQEQWRNAMGGIAAGSSMDRDFADRRMKRDERKRWDDALRKAIGEGGPLSGMSQYGDLFAASPELAAQAIGNSLSPADQPTSFDEFSLAQGNPDFAKFLSNRAAAGAPKTIGSIPQDYQLVYDDNGNPVSMEVIPNSPTARKLEQEQTQQTKATTQERTSANVVVEDIDRATKMIEGAPGWTTGVGGSILQDVPGTTARDVQGLLTTVKANAGFDQLQAMRDASPTGGALGQVSEMELKQLNSAIGNLEQSQSKEQLLFNLKRVRDIYDAIINGPGGGGGGDGWTVAPNGARVRQLP